MKQKVGIINNYVDPRSHPHDIEGTYLIRQFLGPQKEFEEFAGSGLQNLIRYAVSHSISEDYEVFHAARMTYDQYLEIFHNHQYERFYIGGSLHSPHDPETWINIQQQAILDTQLTRVVPMEGVCFGFEQLALANGGKVEKLSQMRQGQQVIKWSDGRQETVRVNHSEFVPTLPPGAEMLAQDVQGQVFYGIRFSNGDRGFQHHPEFVNQSL